MICNLVRMTDLFNVQIWSVRKYRDNIFRAIFCQVLSSGLRLDKGLIFKHVSSCTDFNETFNTLLNALTNKDLNFLYLVKPS